MATDITRVSIAAGVYRLEPGLYARGGHTPARPARGRGNAAFPRRARAAPALASLLHRVARNETRDVGGAQTVNLDLEASMPNMSAVPANVVTFLEVLTLRIVPLPVSVT